MMLSVFGVVFCGIALGMDLVTQQWGWAALMAVFVVFHVLRIRSQLRG